MFIYSDINPEAANRHFSCIPSPEFFPSRTSSSQHQSDNGSTSPDVLRLVGLSRSSTVTTIHPQPHEHPHIVEPEDDDLVERRLLGHLTQMSETLSQTSHGNWMRDDSRVRAIMCQELLTMGYTHIKAKMVRGDMPLSDLHYGCGRTFLKIGPVTEFVTPVEDVERLWCWNQKAVEIMERWPTFDDFFDVWSGVLNRASCSWDKVIIVREY
jgi:hypothetical protein